MPWKIIIISHLSIKLYHKLLFIILFISSLLFFNKKCNKFIERVINNYYESKTDKSLLDKIELTSSLIKIFSDLYDYSRDGYKKPIFTNRFINK
jgi:hypothetical protein